VLTEQNYAELSDDDVDMDEDDEFDDDFEEDAWVSSQNIWNHLTQ
jgi:hypothetical protein